jgi:FKBP-type peptidyl-prolyl cis-trans isomerase FkpA
VLVEVQNEGTGAKADAGKHAKLMYKGYTIDGKVFDANMGADAKHKEPIDVAVGMHNTIPGFEDAMKFFGKGGKGRLLIPSVLAYGDREIPGIAANSNLIFDIEVVDVVAEPAKSEGDTSKSHH